MVGSDHVELRCQWQKHGEAEAGATGVVRIKCRECARKRGGGVIVIHHFHLGDGGYITKVYRDIEEFLKHRHERTQLREA